MRVDWTRARVYACSGDEAFTAYNTVNVTAGSVNSTTLSSLLNSTLTAYVWRQARVNA